MNIYGARHHGCRLNEFTWQGHRLITLENEHIRLAVLHDKGADIIEFRHKATDIDVLWHAPQPVLSPGRQIPSVARSGGSFLDYYGGGWQEIFPSAGPPSVWEGAELGQHGEVSLLPWDVRVRTDTEAVVEIEFSVETMRTPFRLERSMRLAAGSSTLRIEEQITSNGEQPMPYSWGHHPVFGPPFLAADCRIDMPECRILVPSASSDTPTVVKGPEARTDEVVVFSELSEGWYALRNPALSMAVALTWDVHVFPFLWSWQVYGGSWGYPYFGRAYALGLEPFSCPVEPLASLAARNAAPILQPGASQSSYLEASIIAATHQIRRVAEGAHIQL